MKVAFVSCICTDLFPDQPVWQHIAAHRPDHLVLLGDSIYLDIDSPKPPQEMEDDEFAQHLWKRYSSLLAHPGFSSLVRSLPLGRVFSIWDDHDFLWNDAWGAEFEGSPVHGGKVRLSTAFQEAFRRALAAGLAPGSFPASHSDPVFWRADQPRLTTPSLSLAADVRLHLSDGRTPRTRTWLLAESKRAMLGAAQCASFEAAFQQAPPDAIHLFASGSTLAGWKRYGRDWAWLNRMAARHRTLVLSGDIHRNELDGFGTGGFPLHEATSSGVAVKDAVVVGTRKHNFGLLEVTPGQVDVRLFKKGREEMRRTLSRATWLPER